MNINFNLPAEAVDALKKIAYELHELRMGLCPPLPVREIVKKTGMNVRYPNDTSDEEKERLRIVAQLGINNDRN